MTPAELRAAFLRSFPGIAPAIIIAAIDQTIVATALPAIAGSLGAVERISWVVVAWLIAATIAAPVFGRLGDAYGRKRLLIVALGIQAVGDKVWESLEPLLAYDGATLRARRREKFLEMGRNSVV